MYEYENLEAARRLTCSIIYVLFPFSREIHIELFKLCFLKKTMDSGQKVAFYVGPVHTYSDIFKSATFYFRIRFLSTRIRRIRMRIRNFLNPLSRVIFLNPQTIWNRVDGRIRIFLNPLTWQSRV